jgi:hypothetical protein
LSNSFQDNSYKYPLAFEILAGNETETVERFANDNLVGLYPENSHAMILHQAELHRGDDQAGFAQLVTVPEPAVLRCQTLRARSWLRKILS